MQTEITTSQVSNLLNQSTQFDLPEINTLTALLACMKCNDIDKITVANSILTTLKTSTNLFINTISILSKTNDIQTMLFCLIAFEQQLKSRWTNLNLEQKAYLKQFFINSFNFIPSTDSKDRYMITKKMKIILVKIYIFDYSESDTFIDNLIQVARQDQSKCQHVLDLFVIMADQSQTYGTAYLQNKHEAILTLAAMVIKSTQETKLKNNLIKNSMTVLEKFCKLSSNNTFPPQILTVLLEIFASNKFRIAICNLLEIISFQSLENLVSITKGVMNVMDWSCSIQAYRQTIKAKQDNELVFVDMFLRAYASLINKLIMAYLLLRPNNVEEYLQVCYVIILALSESEDKDTWVSCRQAWITYVKLGQNLLNIEELSTRIIFKCEAPQQLQSKPEISNTDLDQQQRQEREDNQNFSTLLYFLGNNYTNNMYTKIWQFIESKAFVKFEAEKFTSCTYALCYLNQSLKDKNKILNILKLLMNMSQSVETANRRIIVTQFLNIVSFFPIVILDNEMMNIVLENKYLQNLPDSIIAFSHYSRNVIKISEEGIEKIVAKTVELGNQELKLQEQLWEIVLRSEGNNTDTRLNHQLQLTDYLPACLRACAGFKVFGLNWNVRWDIMVLIASTLNNLPMQLQLEQLSAIDKRSMKKIEEVIIRLCEVYCILSNINPNNIEIDKTFLGLLQLLKNWEGSSKIGLFFS